MAKDSTKLRRLAKWFDMRDQEEGRIGEDDVQKDLRRIAKRLDKIDKQNN